MCDGVVKKHFATAEAAAFEAKELRTLHAMGVRVPEVYELDGAVLKMQYILGETLPDIIAHLENSTGLPDLEAVADKAKKIIGWFYDFYKAVNTDETGEIRGDVNGRNFVFDGSYCWGVDFEEKSFGDKEKDIGRLIAFALTYEPPGTLVKAELADMLLKYAIVELGVLAEEVCHQRDLELEAMKRRRTKKS